jgi:hypothetical protein
MIRSFALPDCVFRVRKVSAIGSALRAAEQPFADCRTPRTG